MHGKPEYFEKPKMEKIAKSVRSGTNVEGENLKILVL